MLVKMLLQDELNKFLTLVWEQRYIWQNEISQILDVQGQCLEELPVLKYISSVNV